MAKILVADDDLFYRRLVEDSLSEMGHEVISVSNGIEAWERWRQEDLSFDCVILDVYMDGMLGIEILEKMTEVFGVESREIPVPAFQLSHYSYGPFQ
jgi:CheY-like chemotaxis protein